jgi:hypothetical protein
MMYLGVANGEFCPQYSSFSDALGVAPDQLTINTHPMYHVLQGVCGHGCGVEDQIGRLVLCSGGPDVLVYMGNELHSQYSCERCTAHLLMPWVLHLIN